MRKQVYFLLFLLVLPTIGADYYVREDGKNLELVTPYGTKQIISEIDGGGPDNFHIEIPLSDLKPPVPSPAPGQMLGVVGIQQPGGPGMQHKTVVEKVEEIELPEDDDEKKAPAPQKITVEWDETDRMVLEANRLYNRKKYFEAATLIDEVLRKKPSFTRAWVMKGSLMKLQGHKDMAKNAWEKALTLEPENRELQALVASMK